MAAGLFARGTRPVPLNFAVPWRQQVVSGKHKDRVLLAPQDYQPTLPPGRLRDVPGTVGQSFRVRLFRAADCGEVNPVDRLGENTRMAEPDDHNGPCTEIAGALRRPTASGCVGRLVKPR